MEKAPGKNRIELIDGVRGLSVVLMVIHHFLLDLVVLCGAPAWLFSNPVFDFLHYVFAGAFIFLAGVSSRFSRSNVKRGIKVLAIAMGMTIVTGLMNSIIRFGVLHLLGTLMIFWGLTHKAWDTIPRPVMPVLYLAMLIGSNLLLKHVYIGETAARYLFMFGWTYPGFYSADYFPLFPWAFVFLLGTWAGLYIKERRLPEWFYTAKVPVLSKVGRAALPVYIIHQPVCYGIIYLYLFISRL